MSADREPTRHPALRGGVLALAAAAMFGVSTPLVQLFGRGVGAFTTAALLYAGAAAVGASLRQPVEREARLARGDAARLVAIAAFGASLLLTLEALFTALFAWCLYREAIGARVWTALLLLLAGGAVLVLDQGRGGQAGLAGLLAVLAATAAWGMDNALSRALAERDPGRVVLAKASLGAAATFALALLAAEPRPVPAAAFGLLIVGATGYGLSLRFYLLAQRTFGAARTGSVFAAAPFIGAAAALALGDRCASWALAAGGALMAAGVVLHLTEAHAHDHEHEALEHEHAHRHDDGHHDHAHVPMPQGEHSHWHRHAPRRHSHPHVPDIHHAHPH